MKQSIIDIGTRSIKHYIFDDDKEIYFKRDSSVKLGQEILTNSCLEESKIKNAINHIKSCLAVNSKHNTEKTTIIGTDALRKASNSERFLKLLKKETDYNLRIIDHRQEGRLLGQAYTGLIKGDFAAANVGGGSTELVIFKDNKMHIIELPFGVNKVNKDFLHSEYQKGNFNDKGSWNKSKEFLNVNIKRKLNDFLGIKIENMFLTGVLNFAEKQKELAGFNFEKSDIKSHPVKMPLDKYEQFNEKLKEIGVTNLAKNYPIDPGYADNFVIGQQIYICIAKHLGVKTVYPDEIQYIHGIIK